MSRTPMMKQYHEAKSLSGEALLLFRMGDFYELFYEDARTAARLLGLTLTSREKGANPVPMAGFPHHQLDSYLAKLIRLGVRVAVCEQVEDPKAATGLVRREVTRVVTPGTLTDDALLDPKERNYLAAIAASPRLSRGRRPEIGVAWVELSTGRFFLSVSADDRLHDLLARIGPAECLVNEEDQEWRETLGATYTLTPRPDWAFARDTALDLLKNHFGTHSLEGFGITDEDEAGMIAAGVVLDYLRETQKTSLTHIDCLTPHREGTALEIDQAAWRSLELARTIREGGRAGSLLGVMDRTVTSMGSRLLSDWLRTPLTSIPRINLRLEAVQDLLDDPRVGEALRGELREVYDLQRLLTRVTTQRATPRDLQLVARTLDRLPQVQALVATRPSALLAGLAREIDLCPSLAAELRAGLADNCPLATREGGIIRQGYNSDLDQLRELASGGKEWLSAYQASEQARTGIPSLKIGFNRVFGFYLEVTNTHRDKVPPDYLRKQTLKNAERYITPELKEYEDKVLTADEKAKQLEYELFVALRELIGGSAKQLKATADVLAQLDVLASLAELARRQGYCRPTLVEEPVLDVRGARHPVLEVLEPQGTFVPNDTRIDEAQARILLITGPNMAGKSTYIRQVALVSIMAQMGSFVPAQRATIGIADRVFARIGASDELSRGQSTFMVEMTETARILNTATVRSLVVLDEIGRGTSTYDGVSLAWSIIEYLHDQIGCRTLFATHYHELTELAESLERVVNLNVAVREWKGDVVFLHQIVPGAADKSYGIHVAQLAGVPRSVNDRAAEILRHLESTHVQDNGQPTRSARRKQPKQLQLTLFETTEHPLLDEIRSFPIDETSPIDALHKIKAWQESLAGERKPLPR
jgi:DNA mismatch repair protein MutS